MHLRFFSLKKTKKNVYLRCVWPYMTTNQGSFRSPAIKPSTDVPQKAATHWPPPIAVPIASSVRGAVRLAPLHSAHLRRRIHPTIRLQQKPISIENFSLRNSHTCMFKSVLYTTNFGARKSPKYLKYQLCTRSTAVVSCLLSCHIQARLQIAKLSRFQY